MGISRRGDMTGVLFAVSETGFWLSGVGSWVGVAAAEWWKRIPDRGR